MDLELLYRAFMIVFKSDSFRDSEAKIKKTLYIFLNFQLLLQNINFFWQSDLPISDWNKYQEFWVFINFPCIDSLAAKYQINAAFTIYVSSNIVLVIILFLLFMLFIKYDKKIPLILLKVQKFCLEFLYNIYYIPSCISLITLIKYSSRNYQYLQEYTGTIPGSDLNFGTAGVILGNLLIILHIFLMIVYESCSFDISYSLQNNFYARSQNILGIFLKFFLLFQCYLFTNLQLENYELYLKIFTPLYFFISILIVYYVPFHSIFTNSVLLFVYFDGGICILCFLLGLLMNSTTLTVMIVTVSFPFVAIVCYETIKYRFKRFKPIDQSKTSDYFELEHSARKHLVAGDMGIDLLKILDENSVLRNNRLTYVLEANYCNDILLNSELALLKIGTISYKTINFLESYQVFKCINNLEEINIKKSQSLKLFIFLKTLDEVKKKDYLCCSVLINFFTKILEPNQSLSAMKISAIKCYEYIIDMKKCYTNLIKEKFEDQELFDLYGSFLSDILQDKIKGNIYLTKKNTQFKGKRSRRFSLAKEKSSILVISGEKTNLGEILFSNYRTLHFLEVPHTEAKSIDIFQFIPAPFQKIHRFFLKTFVKTCTTGQVSCNKFYFLEINNYLVECLVNTVCVVHKEKTYFLLNLDQLETENREMALISANGEIICHSRGFSAILYEEQNLSGRSILDLFKSLDLSNFYSSRPIKIVLPLWIDGSLVMKTIAVYFEKLMMHKDKYFTVFITDISYEIDEWCRKGAITEIVHDTDETNNNSESEINFNQNLKFKDNDGFVLRESKVGESYIGKSKNTNVSLSQNISNSHESRALFSTLKSLKIIRFFLIFSVSYM